MSSNREGAQHEGAGDRWPTFPTPPTGTQRGGRLLLGVAFLTTIAVYIASFVNAPDRQEPATWVSLTVLFGFFALSIYLFSAAFKHFWRRLAVLLFQIALVFAIVIVGAGMDSLSILYFIIVPMAYLSFSFIQASGIALLCLIALFSSYLITAGAGEALAQLLPYGGGFTFFALVSAALIQQQKDRQRAEQLLVELKDAHRQLRAYAVQVEALAVAEERNRLAREIHDSLGHYLTALTMHLEAAGKLITKDPEHATEVIAKAEEMARESMAEVRRAVTALRESPLDTTLISDAIDELVRDFQDFGIVATFAVEGEAHVLPVQVKTTLYRAAQEGLTNVRKHANASAAEVRLTYQPEEVTLTITDNGIGQRDRESDGFGLLGLRERVTVLGGRMEAGNNPGGGFRLQVVAPRRAGEQEDE